MGTDKLADNVERDPFHTARHIRIDSDSEEDKALQEIIRRLKPPEIAMEGILPLFATPADEPKNVLDAKDAGECVACHGRVWLSPSSLRTMETETVTIFCLRCVLNEFEKVKGTPNGG